MNGEMFHSVFPCVGAYCIRPKRKIVKIVVFLFFILGISFSAWAKPEDPFINKASNAFREGNLANASAFISRAKAISPANQEVLDLEKTIQDAIAKIVGEAIREGDFFAESRNFPKAMEAYKKALVVSPQNAEARAKIAELKNKLLEVDQFQRAGVAVDAGSGRAFDPEMYSLITLMAKAREAYSRQDLTTALKLVEEILGRDKDFGEAKKLQARIQETRVFKNMVSDLDSLQQSGKLQAAVDELGKLIDRRPLEGSLYLWRGRIFLKLQDFPKARDDLLSARRLGVPLSEIRLPLSEVYAGLGQYSQAYALGSAYPGFAGAMPGNFLRWCFLKAYPFTCLFGLLTLLVLLGGFWFFFRGLLEWCETRPPGLLIRTGWFFLTSMFSGHAGSPEKIIALSREWRHPWLAYLAGLASLKMKNAGEARNFFEESLFSPALKAKGLFFIALAQSQIADQSEVSVSQTLEKSLLESLKKRPQSIPFSFLKNLETEVFVTCKDCSSFRENPFYSIFLASDLDRLFGFHLC